MLPSEPKNQNSQNELPISRLFPNMITLLALCSGLSSIRFALDKKWEMAVTFIVIAAFIDLIDGRLARYLKVTSNFGAQLDSLADFCNFGIAPGIILYLWSTYTFPVRGLGWGCVLFFSVCCLIRLARFNADLDEEKPAPNWKKHFFVGVPSTMGGLLALIPMMLSFEFSDARLLNDPKFVGIYMVIVAILMASRTPTFATKKIHIKRKYISVFMAICGLLIVGLIIDPWIVMSFIGIIYIISIIISIGFYLYFQNKYENE